MCDVIEKIIILVREPDAPFRQIGPIHDDKRIANAWLAESGAVQDPANGEKFAFARIIDVQEVEIQRVLKRPRKVTAPGEVGAEPVVPSAEPVAPSAQDVTAEVEQ